LRFLFPALWPAPGVAVLYASRRLARLIAPLLALLLTLAFFWQLALTDRILARGDTFAYFTPYWDARDSALREGRLPVWSPDLFMGVPLLANSQLGTFYPPNWPLAAFPAPDAIKLSILMHVAWAFGGAYLLARRTLHVNRLAALAAALVFALGGHVGAHVEQINQLQGLAWLPWAFLLFDHALRQPWRTTPLLGAVLALQLLAGHTQTVFITGVGLGLYGLLTGRWRFIPVLIGAVVVAVLLALPQLIPTIELTRVSNRSGGFNQNQATAFSFSPFVVGRGLLPSYDRTLFGEYVAYIGVVGIGLALLGVALPQPPAPAETERRVRFLRLPLSPRVTWAVIGLAGLGLALGLYNPLYWWLASLPGFNLFRVPARWLALFTLGAAMLSALGVQALVVTPRRPGWRLLAVVGVVVVALAALSPLATRTPEMVPAYTPELISFVGWGAALLAFGLLVWSERWRRFAPGLLIAILAAELFGASLALPYNDLVPPDTYSAGRFTAYQLRALQSDDQPPDRSLSISNLYFDPGDRAALEARYAALGLSPEAVSTAFTAIKMQEALAPNLPLTWGIPSIDGFDGGLLPTSAYTAFSSLLLPEGALRTLDGRLYEVLAQSECGGACLPPSRWLNLTNTRYLITDKVYDVWHEDVAYDTQFPRSLDAATPLDYRTLPPFSTTAVDVLYTCTNDSCAAPQVSIMADDATTAVDPPIESTAGEQYRLARYPLADASIPSALRLTTTDAVTIHAVTLVDTRTGDFVQLTPFPWQRILSSDIKIYDNADVMPRAFVVHDWVVTGNDWQGIEDALALMRDPAFDPSATVVLSGVAAAPPTGASGSSTARVVQYDAERIEIDVNASRDGYLILTDAFYPGWTASIDGQPAPIFQADVLFRAVAVEAGQSVVTFRYAPTWLPGAFVAGGAAWLIAAAFVVAAFLRGRNARS
jgi:hypothetical protein